MLRTTNGKYAGRWPKCGTTNRMEGEGIAGTATVGWARTDILSIMPSSVCRREGAGSRGHS
jgi:hypothetical protein